MARPREWWPLSDGDPVPGDPEALAALGTNMANAAAEIERVATKLPQIASSGTWDSQAGRQFRAKAVTVAAGVGRTHRRFLAVATALGRSASGGTGYAAQLAACQEQADAAASAVNGTASTPGSERERLLAWTQLLDATGGLDPASPLPPRPAGSTQAAGPLILPPPLPVPHRKAGPYPQPRPGYIPPQLPGFASDPAGVTALKHRYNAAVGQLRSAAQQVSQAAHAQVTAARAAAQAIRSATGSDGLNNVPWYDRLVDDVRGYVSAHWAGFVKELATIASDIATICGIIAMVLAFIPGMQEFAALFETVALLAQAVAFACHSLLLLTGNGSLLDVVVDGVGLVTFGVGKGLIGSAEATEGVAKAVGSAYKATVGDGDDVASLIEAADAAQREFARSDNWKLSGKFMEQMKKTVSVRPVLRNAMKAWQDGKVSQAFGNRPFATLGRGALSAVTMRSPEIGSAFAETVEATKPMDVAQGYRWLLTSRVQAYGQLFRVVQGTGIGSDMGTRVATTLSDHHLPPPGFDSIKDWPVHGGG